MRIVGWIATTLIAVVVVVGGLYWSLYVSGRNVLVRHNNQLELTFGGINNAAQKRADLIPNLVRVVEKYAAQEKDVFIGVTNARSKATSITLPENATPEQIEAFGKAQAELSGALGRLLAVSENYPNMKSDAQFLNLQKELRDAEVQMSGARSNYMRAVRGYNNNVESWPWNAVAAKAYGFEKKPQLDFGPDAAQRRAAPPTVEFGKQ
jgi:LemA protein